MALKSSSPTFNASQCKQAFVAGFWVSGFHGRSTPHQSVKAKSHVTPACYPPRRYRVRASYSNDAAPNRNGEGSSDDPVFNLDSKKYFEQLRALVDSERVLSNPLGLKKSFEIVRFDEDGVGPRDRYVYVEERDCIGCTHCATTAPGTFFMESEYGRARVYDQVGECEAAVEEAIDTCPVNCIYYVDWADLVKLENMREGQAINNWSRLVGGQDHTSSRKGQEVTNVMDSGIMRCTDCPARGCLQCPLYGVGQNPEFLRKKAAREERARKRKSRDSRKDARKRL